MEVQAIYHNHPNQPSPTYQTSIFDISDHPDFHRHPAPQSNLSQVNKSNRELKSPHYKTTQPIRETDTREHIKQLLLQSSPKYGYRNWLIFNIGISVGRRCGDILTLRIRDVWDEASLSVKERIEIQEEKTRKKAVFKFNPQLSDAIRDYIMSLPNRDPDAPLFPSRKSSVVKADPHGKPRVKDDTGCLTTSSYWRILKEIGNTLGIHHFGTHTMRKTFGYEMYQKHKDQPVEGKYAIIDVLQSMFGHSSTSQTSRYIGLTEEINLNLYENFVL